MQETQVPDRDELLEKLLKRNSEFRRLYKSHQSLEAKLDRMNRLKKLTDEDEVERKKIQKLKLKQKDQMEQILSGVSKQKRKFVA